MPRVFYCKQSTQTKKMNDKKLYLNAVNHFAPIAKDLLMLIIYFSVAIKNKLDDKNEGKIVKPFIVGKDEMDTAKDVENIIDGLFIKTMQNLSINKIYVLKSRTAISYMFDGMQKDAATFVDTLKFSREFNKNTLLCNVLACSSKFLEYMYEQIINPAKKIKIDNNVYKEFKTCAFYRFARDIFRSIVKGKNSIKIQNAIMDYDFVDVLFGVYKSNKKDYVNSRDE